jgi:hypothetical protein
MDAAPRYPPSPYALHCKVLMKNAYTLWTAFSGLEKKEEKRFNSNVINIIVGDTKIRTVIQKYK